MWESIKKVNKKRAWRLYEVEIIKQSTPDMLLVLFADLQSIYKRTECYWSF